MNNEELFEKIINFMEKPIFMKLLVHQNRTNEKRMELLQEILAAIEQEKLEQSRIKIFEYGSLIGKDDLLARQIFLGLLFCLEDQEKFQMNLQ